MTNLEKLLDGIEVEWFTLGDERFVKIDNSNRRAVKHSERVSGPYPYYGANNIQDNVEGYTHNGTYILLAEDGTNSIENYSVQWATGKFWANNHVHVLRGIGCLNSRFLFHYLQTVNFTPFLTGGGRPKLTKNKLRNIQIPIPCPNSPKKSLEIQLAIVETLDKFTKLEAELEAELDCRKRQYDYYRNKLLYSDLSIVNPKTTDITYKTVGDIFDIRNGYTPSKANMDYWMEGSIPWFRMEDIRTNGSILNDSIQHITPHAIKGKGLFKANSIILATTATIGVHALLKVDSLANQRFTNFSVREALKDSILPEFLYYYFFVIDEWCKQNVYISSFPSVDMEKLNKQLVLIPSLSEQRRIVSILSKFDKLTTSISEGLPREIELRRKQYEYYRNKLLSFTNTKITQ